MFVFRYQRLYAVLLFLIVIVADRITKLWALQTLSAEQWSICYGLNFVLLWNRGISWSLFSTQSQIGFWILTGAISCAVTGFTVFTVWRARHKFPVFFEALVLGGALSNIIDRFWYGAVIDFIELYVGSYSWPVFNIADSMIVIGVGGMLLRVWWCNEEHPDKIL